MGLMSSFGDSSPLMQAAMMCLTLALICWAATYTSFVTAGGAAAKALIDAAIILGAVGVLLMVISSMVGDMNKDKEMRESPVAELPPDYTRPPQWYDPAAAGGYRTPVMPPVTGPVTPPPVPVAPGKGTWAPLPPGVTSVESGKRVIHFQGVLTMNPGGPSNVR